MRAPLGALSIDKVASLAQVNQTLGATLTPLFRPPPRDPAALARYQALGMDRFYRVTAANALDAASAVTAYQADPAVELAETDPIGSGGATAPNDPNFAGQWNMARVDALGAWDISLGSSDMVIAVLDTGVASGHPELRNRLWRNPGEIAGNGVDDDGNGYVDDAWGWDFVNGDNAPEGDHWHGTHVAGIIGAEAGNGVGIAGLDRRARLMPVKVLNASNQGYYSDWAAGVYYAVQNGARVLNLSLGGEDTDYSALRAAVSYAHGQGAAVVVAMMNANTNRPFYPAAFPESIAVGATDRNDARAAPFTWGSGSSGGGSNYGPYIDVVAPGNLIPSLYLNGGYYTESGTSMATPLVAALSALIWSAAPNLTNEEVRQVLRETADDRVGRASEDTPGWDQYMGYGRVNAARALARARALAAPVAPTSTPTPGPTRSPTPPAMTPTPPAITDCGPALVNGGFDNRDGWTLSGQRALITATGHTGSGLFLGLQSADTPDPAGSWASARQAFTLPSVIGRAELSFWAWTGHTGGADTADVFLARLLDQDGQTLVDFAPHVDSGAWEEYRFDLTERLSGRTGQTLTLYLGTRNLPGTGGNAYMRVDDVSLNLCVSDVTPAAPTLTPTVDVSPTPTVTPTVDVSPAPTSTLTPTVDVSPAPTVTPTVTATPYPPGPYKVYLPRLDNAGTP